VIGGGVIGLEVAATARGLGCEVVVIEAADRLMGRAASPTISDYMRRRHEEAGVGLRLSTTATPFECAPDCGFVLRLSSGEMLEAGIVVVGVGVIPNADLAAEAGLAIEKGAIVVDAHGATGDPRIYAAGEVAAHFNGWFGRHDRQETWNHAAAHGAHVGQALVATAEPYRQLPSYWSDQFDINLMIEGEPSGEADIVRGDPASGRFLVFHISAGAVAGVSAVNSARELRAAKRLIGRPADPAALADSAVGLATLAAA
jgi:3-phenylpropionate/trans-cinnamate dioxygenase ferredoxin reductase subunit